MILGMKQFNGTSYIVGPQPSVHHAAVARRDRASVFLLHAEQFNFLPCKLAKRERKEEQVDTVDVR